MEREAEEWEYREVAAEEANRPGLVNHLRAHGWQLVGESGRTLIFRRPRPVARVQEEPVVDRAILLVVADSSRRFHLSATLAIEGYRVLEASDTAGAQTTLEQSRPGIAILDGRLPGRSLVELVETIRREPHLRHTRIVVLAANRVEAAVAGALAGRVDVHLPEPLAIAELLAHLDRLSGGGS